MLRPSLAIENYHRNPIHKWNRITQFEKNTLWRPKNQRDFLGLCCWEVWDQGTGGANLVWDPKENNFRVKADALESGPANGSRQRPERSDAYEPQVEIFAPFRSKTWLPLWAILRAQKHSTGDVFLVSVLLCCSWARRHNPRRILPDTNVQIRTRSHFIVDYSRRVGTTLYLISPTFSILY